MKPERAETLSADDAPECREGITRTTKMREDFIRLSHFSFYIWGGPGSRRKGALTKDFSCQMICKMI